MRLCFLSLLLHLGVPRTLPPSGHLYVSLLSASVTFGEFSPFAPFRSREQRWQPFLRPPDPLSLCPPPSLLFVITRTEEGSHLNLAQLCCGCCVHTEAWQVRLSLLARAWVYLHSLLCSPSGQKSIGFCISQHPGKKKTT